MEKFNDIDFLLETGTAKYLYHQHAAKMPIIDYHSHLNVKEIAENKVFENITQAWLYGDHYKWRAMRTNGVDEKFCTGNAGDFEKFEKWAETVPNTLRNPLYHWTHLELKNYFGINKILAPKTTVEIYETASSLINSKQYSTQNLLKKMKVELVCTTDDPTDSLEYHIKINKKPFGVKVLPTWRPDKALAIEQVAGFNQYLDKLSDVSKIDIVDFKHLLDALRKRHDFFHKQGCRLSDHGIETFYAETCTQEEIEKIFDKARTGINVSPYEAAKFKSEMLYLFGIMDHEKGWVQQFHTGAMRNNNTRMFEKLGPDTGFDSIGDFNIGLSMSRFLNSLDMTNQLAKTILYNLNPRDNELFTTMIGNFQDGSIPGKIQYGSGWWFLDQKEGIEKQINALSNMGLLSRFVGMLTDSRSFLSFPRHEYFRRILCNILGNEVEKGLIPDDMELLGKMVENICYFNALKYFNFDEIG
ncbi:MAG: glucuronate isomerase [Bacteroidales bacterium]